VTREELIAQQQKAPTEKYMGKGESVLVVDDIAERRDIAARLLTTDFPFLQRRFSFLTI